MTALAPTPQPTGRRDRVVACIKRAPRTVKRWMRKQPATFYFVVVLLGLGTYGLALATNVGLAVLLIAGAVIVGWRSIDEFLGRMLGATLFAAVGLAGFNVLVDQVVELPILVGLFVALLVFGLVAGWYIRQAEWPRGNVISPIALALVMILGIPWLVGRSVEQAESQPVEVRSLLPSALDVFIVTDGTRHAVPRELPPDDALRGFDMHFAVGVADGDGVRWTLADTKDPAHALRVASQGADAPTDDRPTLSRPRVDSALILLVDGTPPVMDAPETLDSLDATAGETERWRRIARVATRADIPTYALLQTTNKDRIAAWEGFTNGGSAVSVHGLASPSVTDAGVRLGIAAPGARGDFALAVQYRPILLFDSAEPVPRPLSVEALFAEGRVRLCRDDRALQTSCPDEPVKDPAKLRYGGTHLRLELRSPEELQDMAQDEQRRVKAAKAQQPVGAPPGTPPATDTQEQPLGAGSAMYVNAVSRGDKLYLDYWWYLQDNPAETGAGAFCGAGLVIPGITCHNHQSDWEGLTVVVDRSRAEPVVTHVHYAQHNKVVRYEWSKLRSEWAKDKYKPYLADVSDPSTRPLAFSARGTHATYPAPCGRCPQEPKGIATIGENPHDGRLIWSGNDTSTCGKDACLKPLPTRDRGHQPALWNDFAGPWGERNCRFRYYCDRGSPPQAPGHQRRFREPWAFTTEGR